MTTLAKRTKPVGKAKVPPADNGTAERRPLFNGDTAEMIAQPHIDTFEPLDFCLEGSGSYLSPAEAGQYLAALADVLELTLRVRKFVRLAKMRQEFAAGKGGGR